jgi:hypothetical protein
MALAAAALGGLLLPSCAGSADSGTCTAGPFPTSCTPAPLETEGCNTPIAINVSAGLNPRIDWTPQCGITHLVVTAVGSEGLPGVLAWSFSAPERAPVRPSIPYGELPSGAILEGPTRPLVSGTTYRVSLEMIVGGDIAGRGTLEFRP